MPPSYRLISIANLTCSRTGGPILAQSLAYAPPFESLEACRLLRPSLQGAWKRQAQQILADLSAFFSPASVLSRCTAIWCQHVLQLTGRRRVQAQPTRPGGSAHVYFPATALLFMARHHLCPQSELRTSLFSCRCSVVLRIDEITLHWPVLLTSTVQWV